VIDYVSLEEQVEADFSRACRRVLIRQVGTRWRRDAGSDGLLCFDDLRKIPRAVGRIHRGIRTVPVWQIGCSVGRCSEFDRDFMAARASVKEVEAHRPGVLEGRGATSHEPLQDRRLLFRLRWPSPRFGSRYHGVEWIDAYVTEFNSGL
jgi:hypothetical protein